MSSTVGHGTGSTTTPWCGKDKGKTCVCCVFFAHARARMRMFIYVSRGTFNASFPHLCVFYVITIFFNVFIQWKKHWDDLVDR